MDRKKRTHLLRTMGYSSHLGQDYGQGRVNRRKGGNFLRTPSFCKGTLLFALNVLLVVPKINYAPGR